MTVSRRALRDTRKPARHLLTLISLIISIYLIQPTDLSFLIFLYLIHLNVFVPMLCYLVLYVRGRPTSITCLLYNY